ncbi:maleylacetoacetate isomerase [Thiotrichales bacterium 19S3-7]|nr:maleylacetoacetate isomerase [Thiotrichales bacterium 19S3-7]MCF6801480.1 maleylacetoacetate isomerase [Thiotrichales bacterium 19S3-11]
MIKLYDYFRSSASYRVRIALELKQIPYELIEVHLVNNGGEQYSDRYQSLNPMQRVPTLVDDGFILSQSLAIITYLDQKYPQYPLLSNNITTSAQILSIAQTIACDIHPLNNLSVLNYLKHNLNCSDDEKSKWYAHWIINGFNAIERQLKQTKGIYSFANEITLADLCLIPQVYNAIRFEINLENYPIINSIYENCNQLTAFKKASPEYVQQNQMKAKTTS